MAAAIESQQQAAAKLALSAREELIAVTDRLGGPDDALAAFQREMRHEVARISDMVASHGAEAAGADATLSQRLEGSEVQAAATTGGLVKISERMSSVQTDLSELHKAIDALRAEVAGLRSRDAARRRWGRSG